MSAPLIWILIPLLVGLALLLFYHWQRVTVWVATISAVVLSILALILPVGELIIWRSLQFEVSEAFNFFGRQVIIDRSDTIILLLIFGGTAFWIGGAYLARAPRLLPGLGLISAALIVMALSVEPFLYAALIIFLVALINLPLLVKPGEKAGKGIMRYLVFQTLGMPFILFVGWMLTGLGSGAAQADVAWRALVMLGVGFALWLAIFPFHSWVPLISQESHPYAAAYLLNMLTLASLLFLYGLIVRYTWLRDSVDLIIVMRSAGVLMIVVNGAFAIAERRQSRLIGYALLLDIGFSLVALSALDGHYQLFFALFIPRNLAFAVWTLALSRSNLLDSGETRSAGIERRVLPFAGMGILVGHFSIAGFPLLAGFPVKLAVLESLATTDITAFGWALTGIGGFLAAGLRSLVFLLAGEVVEPSENEQQRSLNLALLAGILFIVIFGLLPGWFMPIYINLLP